MESRSNDLSLTMIAPTTQIAILPEIQLAVGAQRQRQYGPIA